MYDRSGCGRLLRRYTALSLAWWHNYKWATKQIVRVFGSDFIIPLFHHLFPDRSFAIDKVKHSSLSTYISYIRLAYDSFSAKLSDAVQRDGMNRHQKTILTNLQDLCEFFIPAVTCCCYGCHYMLFIVYACPSLTTSYSMCAYLYWLIVLYTNFHRFEKPLIKEKKQVQDYYVQMKLNKRVHAMMSMYRMFLASYMLRNVQVPGMYSAHNYPRIQLAHILMLEHWRATSHVNFDMMNGHMYMYNEEYGEIYVSLLSRCVLGDFFVNPTLITWTPSIDYYQSTTR